MPSLFPPRALLLTTYVKFINLFPEIKQGIQDILSQDSNLKNADAELQQRASEYLQLSKVRERQKGKEGDFSIHIGALCIKNAPILVTLKCRTKREKSWLELHTAHLKGT